MSHAQTAHAKALAMFIDCFDLQEDHDCINMAMDNYPTMAIFMAQVDSKDANNTRGCTNEGK